MTRIPAISAAALALSFAAGPALAQSSLGIAGGELTLGVTTPETGDALGFAEGWLDVAITGAHGLQLDFALTETGAGTLGHAGLHLYLAPRAGQKYGLFAGVSDLDGEGFTLGTAGVEARIALGDRTALEARAGIGIADMAGALGTLDFLFAGLGIDHELTDSLRLGLHGEVAEYDETGFRAVGYTVVAEAEYRPGDSPVAVTLGVGVSGLDGRDGQPQETFARLGVSYSFGARGGDPSRRAFRSGTGYAPLALRGIF